MKQPGESLLLPLFWGSVELLFREAVCGSLHWLPSWHQSAVKSISVSSGSPDLRSYYLALVDMPRGAHHKSTAAEGRQASPCLVNKVSALFTVTQIANRCKVHKQAGLPSCPSVTLPLASLLCQLFIYFYHLFSFFFTVLLHALSLSYFFTLFGLEQTHSS